MMPTGMACPTWPSSSPGPTRWMRLPSSRSPGPSKPSNEVQLFWTTRTNKSYQLQQTDRLGDGAAWTNLGPALTGTDGVLTQSVGADDGRLSLLPRPGPLNAKTCVGSGYPMSDGLVRSCPS